MTQLIACLSTGKGTWSTLAKLMNNHEWSKIILITNEFGKSNFTPNDKTELIECNLEQDTHKLRDQIFGQLKQKVSGMEVAVNFCSGLGKEHMALLSAVLKLGVGLRVVDFCDGKIEEI
jgi:hypothetical protein